MMTWTGQIGDENHYRVVLVLSRPRMILAERHGTRRRLPRISIPKRTRTAKQLTEAIQQKWGVSSIVIDFLPIEQALLSCAVIEVLNHGWEFGKYGFMAAQVDDLEEQELAARERSVVLGILRGDRQGRGPFSRPGWVGEAQQWIQACLPGRLIEFNEDVRQFNAGGTFALVFLGTRQKPAYWLKATGSPNTHEYTITTTLARYLPDYLPPLVAARDDWNAWVMEDMGQSLHSAFTSPRFEQAVHCLAQLQKTSTVYVDLMLAGGCFDHRIPNLRAHLPQLIHYLDEAMARQTSARVLPIGTKRLRELEILLEDACSSIEALRIPDALLHNDMNLGNVLSDGVRTVFTDWAEACIGNPFLTFERLRAQTPQENSALVPQLTGIYKKHWRSMLCESTIERALALSPPIAIAAYVYGRDMTFSASYRNDPCVESYARSLARHMDRAVQSPDFVEALCH
jgi:hypothetical protein